MTCRYAMLHFWERKRLCTFCADKTRFVPAVAFHFTFGTEKGSVFKADENLFCPCRCVSLHFRDRKSSALFVQIKPVLSLPLRFTSLSGQKNTLHFSCRVQAVDKLKKFESLPIVFFLLQ